MLVLFLLPSFLLWPVAPLHNGLALTPPMGFNMGGGTNGRNGAGLNFSSVISQYHCLSGIDGGINETKMIQAADYLHSSGMFAAGYTHVHSDDCWEAGPGRVGVDSQGFGKGKFPNSTEFFPHGYKWLADYLHTRQVRHFGTLLTHTRARAHTCEYACVCEYVRDTAVAVWHLLRSLSRNVCRARGAQQRCGCRQPVV